MAELLRDLLIERGETISFAESCTGGLATSNFVAVPGVSRCLLGSVVSYSNESKIDVLNVPREILQKNGAVSRECAIAMADGCRERFGSDLAVSITGHAGPAEYADDPKLGLVYIACSDRRETLVEEHHLIGTRNKIRRITALRALDLARRQLQKGEGAGA